jgi:hypothetical protein
MGFEMETGPRDWMGTLFILIIWAGLFWGISMLWERTADKPRPYDMSPEDRSAAISAAGDAEEAWIWAQSYLVAEELTDNGPDAVAHIRAARLVLMKLFDAWKEAEDKAGITDCDDCIASFQAMEDEAREDERGPE